MSDAIEHGGRLDAAMARYGGEPEDWLDLSTGINPFAYDPGKIGKSAWQRLPDEAAMAALLNAARDFYQLPHSTDLVAANGSQALIEILPRVLTANKIATIWPGYGEHQLCWHKAGAKIRLIVTSDEVHEDESLVVTNPNNPDGRIFDHDELLAAAQKIAPSGGTLIVDQAFCDCVPEHSIFVGDTAMPENILVLTSFGKFFGLAGLRLGFALGAPEIIARIRAELGLWSVSGPAMAIGTKAFGDDQWIAATRKRLRDFSIELCAVLRANGFKIVGSHPLFVYAYHEAANAVYEALARQHILARHFSDDPLYLRFGLPGGVAELKRLEAALGKVSIT